MNPKDGNGCAFRWSRRRLMQSALTVAVGGMVFVETQRSTALGADCADKEEQSGLRESLHYTEKSPDAKQTCQGCAFFSAGEGKQCGHCQILGGSVSEGGRCDSWSPVQK